MRFRHLHFLATFDYAEIPWKMEKVLTDENGPISNAELPINSIKTSPIRQEINEVNFKNAIKAANICMHYPIANVNQKVCSSISQLQELCSSLSGKTAEPIKKISMEFIRQERSQGNRR